MQCYLCNHDFNSPPIVTIVHCPNCKMAIVTDGSISGTITILKQKIRNLEDEVIYNQKSYTEEKINLLNEIAQLKSKDTEMIATTISGTFRYDSTAANWEPITLNPWDIIEPWNKTRASNHTKYQEIH